MNTLDPVDIEEFLVEHLDEVSDIPWSTQPIRTRQEGSEPFGVLRRVGGVRGRWVTDEPMVTVEAWAPDRSDAYRACADACTELQRLVGEVTDGVTVYRVAETSGPANLPDPESTMPRYTATVLVRVRST
jgi:hypothetical protein